MYAVIPACDIVQHPTKEGFSLKHPGYTPDHYLPSRNIASPGRDDSKNVAHKRKVPLNDISTKRNSLQPEGNEMKTKKKKDSVEDKMSSSSSRNSLTNTGGRTAAAAGVVVTVVKTKAAAAAAAGRARQSNVVGSGTVPSARSSKGGGGLISASAFNSASHPDGSNHRRTDSSSFNDDAVENSDSSHSDNDSDNYDHSDSDSDSGDSRSSRGMVQDKGKGKEQEKGNGKQGSRTSMSTNSGTSRVSLSVSKHIPTSTAQQGARNDGSGSDSHSHSDSDVDSSDSTSKHSDKYISASRQLISSKMKKNGSSSRGEGRDRDSEGKGNNVRRSNGSSSTTATKQSRPTPIPSTSTSASKLKSQSKPVSSRGAGPNRAVDTVKSSKCQSKSLSERMAGLDTQHAVSLNQKKSRSSASAKAGSANSVQMKKSATIAKNVVRKSKETNTGKEEGKEKITVIGAGKGNVKGKGTDDGGCVSDFHRICLGMHLTDYSPGKNYFPSSYHTNGQEYGFTDYDRSKSMGDEEDDSESNEYDTDEPIFIEKVEKLEVRKVFEVDEENYFYDYEDDKTEMEFESDAGPETVEAACSSSDDEDEDESEGKGGGDVSSVQMQINGADRRDVGKVGGDTRSCDYEGKSRSDSHSDSGSGRRSCVDLTGGCDSQKQKTGERVEDGSDEDDEIMSVHSSICDDNDNYNCDYSDKGDDHDQDDGDDELHSVHFSVDSTQHTPPPHHTPDTQHRPSPPHHHTPPPHHHTPHAQHHTPPPHPSTEQSQPAGNSRASLSRAAKIPECNYGSTSDDDNEDNHNYANTENNKNIENNDENDKVENNENSEVSAVKRLVKSPSSVSTSPSGESIERGREREMAEAHSRADDDDRILDLHTEEIPSRSADEHNNDGEESSSRCDGTPLKAKTTVKEKEKDGGRSRDGELQRCTKRQEEIGEIVRDEGDAAGEEVADRMAPLSSALSVAIKRSHRESSRGQKEECKRIYIDISDSESVTDQITRIDSKAKKISKKWLALISKEEKKKITSRSKKKEQAPEDFTNFSKIILKNIPRPETLFSALYEGVQSLYLDEGMESVRYFAGYIEDRSALCCLFPSVVLLNKTHFDKPFEFINDSLSLMQSVLLDLLDQPP